MVRKWSVLSFERRQKLSNSMKNNKRALGFKQSQETKDKRAMSNMKKEHSLKILEIFDDDVIIGLLLSDAHLSRPYTEFQNSSFSISISSKYKTFPYYVEDYLKKLNLNVHKKEFTRKTGVIHWNVKTTVDKQFTELRKIWYPNGIKIVPRYLKLNPKIIAYWFMGDGSSGYYLRGNKKVVLSLQTQRFSLNDVLFLKYQLELLDIKMNINMIKRESIGYILITKVSFEVEKFMKLVEPYILPDFEYKIKHPYVNSKTGVVPSWMTDNTRHKCQIVSCIKTAEKEKSKCNYHNHHPTVVV